MPLLALRQLSVEFHTKAGVVSAVRGVDLSIEAGRTLGLVGASGSGKTVTCHAILDLLPPNAVRRSGRAIFQGQDLLARGGRLLRKVRGGRMAMIFQNPVQSLNPVLSIGRQIGESLALHRRLRGTTARREAERLLGDVGITDPAARLKAFPHQLSGGMCQRVMIAMALAARPDLIIADEPTTALDLTTQAQILDLLRRLQRDHGTALLLVTHDMGVIARMAHDVVVMDQGRIIEEGSVVDLFGNPGHAVTRSIIAEASRLPVDPTITPPAGILKDRH